MHRRSLREELGRSYASHDQVGNLDWQDFDDVDVEITADTSGMKWLVSVQCPDHTSESLPTRSFTDEASANAYARSESERIHNKLLNVAESSIMNYSLVETLLPTEYSIANISYETLCLESDQFFANIDKVSLLQEGVWDNLTNKAKKFVKKLGDGFKEKLDEIKALADKLKVGLKDFLEVLRAQDGFLFKLFAAIGYSKLGQRMLAMITAARDAYKDFREFIFDAIEANPSLAPVVHTVKWISVNLDAFFAKYPKWKKGAAVIFATILLVIWLNQGSTGDFHTDWDLSPIIKCLTGDYSVYQLFASSDGIDGILLAVFGQAIGSLFNPYKNVTDGMKIVIALVYTFGSMYVGKKWDQYKEQNDIDPVGDGLEDLTDDLDPSTGKKDLDDFVNDSLIRQVISQMLLEVHGVSYG